MVWLCSWNREFRHARTSLLVVRYAVRMNGWRSDIGTWLLSSKLVRSRASRATWRTASENCSALGVRRIRLSAVSNAPKGRALQRFDLPMQGRGLKRALVPKLSSGFSQRAAIDDAVQNCAAHKRKDPHYNATGIHHQILRNDTLESVNDSFTRGLVYGSYTK